MGIYLFRTNVIREHLTEDARKARRHDFGKNIIPRMIKDRGSTHTSFTTRTRKPFNIGATSERWTPIGKRTWTWWRWTRSSTCMTQLAHPHVPRAISAGQIRLRARLSGRQHGSRAGFHRVWRLYRFRVTGAKFGFVPNVSVQDHAEVRDSILMENVVIGEHEPDSPGHHR